MPPTTAACRIRTGTFVDVFVQGEGPGTSLRGHLPVGTVHPGTVRIPGIALEAKQYLVKDDADDSGVGERIHEPRCED